MSAFGDRSGGERGARRLGRAARSAIAALGLALALGCGGAGASLPPEAPGRPLLFGDEFEAGRLEPTRWQAVLGSPLLGNGRLTMAGSQAGRAEVQSALQVFYGVLEMAIESSDWKPQDVVTDSSFGFELWSGLENSCHFGVLFIASGHLGLLRAEPDATGRCHGDPLHQLYVPITNWDALRVAGRLQVRLSWSAQGSSLEVTDGSAQRGEAVANDPALPTLPLGIRLNADFDETYRLDYVRVYAPG